MKKAILLIIPIILIVTAITGCTSQIDKEAISNVTNLIGAISDVNNNSGPKIEAAENAYSNLDKKLQKKWKTFSYYRMPRLHTKSF